MSIDRAKRVALLPVDGASNGAVTRAVQLSLTRAGREVTLCRPKSSHHDELNFIKDIKAFVELTRPDVLLPIFHPEVLARHKEEFPGLKIPVDSSDKIELLDSKILSYHFAESLGIPVPRLINASFEPPESFPVVFRRDSGQGGDGVYFPKDTQALGRLLSNSRPDSYIVTEFIEGRNLSVDVLRWDDFFYAGAYEALLPQSKGASFCRRSIVNEELTLMASRMLERLDYRGVCGLDFRQTPDGRLYFLECNPRFGAGVISQLFSHFDLPELLIQLSEGGHPSSSDIRFRAGIITKDKAEARSYLKKRAESGLLSWRDIRYALLTPSKHFI